MGVVCRQLVEAMLHREPETRASLDAVTAHRYLNDHHRPRSLPATAIHTMPAFGPDGQPIVPHSMDRPTGGSRSTVLTQNLTQAQPSNIPNDLDDLENEFENEYGRVDPNKDIGERIKQIRDKYKAKDARLEESES